MRQPSRPFVFPAILAVALFFALAAPSSAARAGSWIEGAPMTTARAYAGGVRIGDDLYVIGGSGTSGPRSLTEVYDTVGNIWRAAAALPVGLEQFGIAESGGKIYVAGGYSQVSNRDGERDESESNALWIFDPVVGVWVSGPPMPSSRVGLGLVSAGGKLYALGGRGNEAGRVFIFDPRAGAWSVAKAAMPAPRTEAAFAVVGNSIYVIGGFDGHPMARVDILDTATGGWRSGPALPSPRAGHAAVVMDGRIHVVGGESISPPRTFADHFLLDGASWSRLESMPTPRHAVVATAAKGKLFVVGGSAGAGVYTVFTETDVVDIYSTGK
ncbi:MAG: kelch repeat-containing protein [Parvibaculum sp.]|jgi:N-acetylneuraminic acid mutarotase|uniref:Kelch repeat-containing protein n=1 Tax=Parvibaculum sp. TaxID=2024848 RepID=UPI002846F9B4|nr:kelch repeat-containing protein [Parvibaculum sp.]MDR3499129.1 kelch repeat-containing protein [Parvibaculum sp.]